MSDRKNRQAISNGKDMSRAQRRHEREVLKKARQVYWGHRGPSRLWGEPLNERQLGILVSTPAVCSCMGCGNPRKHPGKGKDRLSIAELAQAQRKLHDED